MRFKQADFISLDARRFRVRVADESRVGEQSVTVSLSVLAPEGGSHCSAARDVALSRVAPGVFESTNLLLVADAEDAACDWPDTAQGTSHRLILSELGGTVRAEYADARGESRTNEVPVGKNVTTVTVDVFVMMTNGVRAVQDDIVQRDLADMAERYAQADVRVQAGQVKTVEMPAGVAANWWVANDFTNGTFQLTTDAMLILDALPRTAGHIGVAYVHGPLFDNDIVALYATNRNGVVGTAVGAYAFPASGDVGYLGNVFISSYHSSTLFASAHEVGHILVNFKDHDTAGWDLLRQTHKVVDADSDPDSDVPTPALTLP